MKRRILSAWFPRLGAEYHIRRDPALAQGPFALVHQSGQVQEIASVEARAEAAGVRVGLPLREAQALCPDLITKIGNPRRELAQLAALARWARKFSPWVAQEAPASLRLDITGCAHLFGGEAGLLAQMEGEAAALGLTLRCGVADTLGGAWALARFAGRAGEAARSGDAIDMEARATRSRAAKRHWTRGGTAPEVALPPDHSARIAPVGQLHAALSPLPVAALRIERDTREALTRLGLRRIGDLAGQARAPLARRFGKELTLRLDQALGRAPEPISPEREAPRFATRLSFPDPIGLVEDVSAALDRLLPRLCTLLEEKGQGALTVRLEGWRVDGSVGILEVRLARPTHHPHRILPLLLMKLDDLEAGFGIDMLRLTAPEVRALDRAPNAPRSHRNGSGERRETEAQEDLIARLGARLGMEALTRVTPAETHLPECRAHLHAAAWAPDCPEVWPQPPTPRPEVLFRPEPVAVLEAEAGPLSARPPHRIRWRRGQHALTPVLGPERIMPEWWNEGDDAWRSGPRDYWHVTTDRGLRLWLFFAHGGDIGGGWFCHGQFQ